MIFKTHIIIFDRRYVTASKLSFTTKLDNKIAILLGFF